MITVDLKCGKSRIDLVNEGLQLAKRSSEDCLKKTFVTLSFLFLCRATFKLN
jgi:hypothetical protein